MSLKEIKGAIRDNIFVQYYWQKSRWNKYSKRVDKISDKEYAVRRYEELTNKKFDIENPKTFSEKLQWLKVYYRDSLITKCSDKATMKDYLAEIGYGDMAVPTYGLYSDAKDIDVKNLPEQFIMKASHGSHMNIVVTDKKKINWWAAKRLMNMWLKEDLYVFAREWNYHNDHHRIVIEELLGDEPPVDYKVLCFNGTPRAFQVNHNKDGVHYVDFYLADWTFLENMQIGGYNHSDKPLPKPEHYEEMLKAAEEISKPFPHVRVDFYDFGGKLYIGELTFFTGGGYQLYSPPERDLQFGEWLTLPEKNHEA